MIDRRGLVCVVACAAWGCPGGGEEVEEDAGAEVGADAGGGVEDAGGGSEEVGGGPEDAGRVELPRGLECPSDLSGEVVGQSAQGRALAVTSAGVFWLAGEGGRLTVGPPGGPRLDLGPDAELADLAARGDGEVCAIWRDGEEGEVKYACSPEFAVESTSGVPATRALVLAQGERLCTETSCVESEAAYAFYHDENNTAAAATRFMGLWTGSVFGEQPLGRFGDALAWEGRPFACLVDSAQRGAVIAYGEQSAQMERRATEDELLFRGSPGVDQCRMAAVDGGVEVVWFGGGFGDYEVRLGTYSPYDPETGTGPTYVSAPLELGLENPGYTVAGLGSDLAVAYDVGRGVRLARRVGGAWGDEELAPAGFANVGTPRLASGPDGSLHLVAVGEEGAAYWRWCGP
jgi:hypothetical protein